MLVTGWGFVGGMGDAEVVTKTCAMLASRNRSRECLEQLRRFVRAVLGWDSGSSPSPSTAPVIQALFKAVQDARREPRAPRKLVVFFGFCLGLLGGRVGSELGFLRVDLAETYESWLVSLLTPLLVNSGSLVALRKNLANLAGWAATESPAGAVEEPPHGSVQAAFHGMLLLARHTRVSLQYAAHIRPFELALIRVLGRAPRVARLKGGGFFKASATQAPTTELDGRPTEGLFTVLSSSLEYSFDQMLNVQAFTSIRRWLSDMYVKLPAPEEELLTRKLDPALRECVVEYCLRVLAQSRLTIVDEPTKSNVRNSTKALVSICLAESVRILDVLCTLDTSLVPRIFPVVRASAPSHASLEVLEFILHHAPLSSDCNPLFRAYFSSLSPDDPVTAFNLVAFSLRNQEALLERTTVFTTYFPAYLKLVAWHPLTLSSGISKLMSSMVSRGTFLELVHSVLDLPLVAASLEDVLCGLGDEMSALSEPATSAMIGNLSMDGMIAGPETPGKMFGGGGLAGLFPETPPSMTMSDRESDPFRVIVTLLLRNESGIGYSFWDGEDISVTTAFCKTKTVSLRVSEVARVTPSLFAVLCDVLLSQSLEEEHLEALLRVIFARVNLLFPLPTFQEEIRQTLENKVLAIFHCAPQLVVELRALIISAISSSTFSATELTLNLCWLVGEHAAVCSSDVIREYHEALELFCYERLSMISMVGDNEDELVFHSRLMLALISCLTKLAVREAPLISRVMLTLAKISSQAGFEAPVYEACRERLMVLPTPLALICYGQANSYPRHEQRFDEFSSLDRLRASRAPEHGNVLAL